MNQYYFIYTHIILAATKELCEWFSPSVRPSHLSDYVPIIVSSWNFQELLPVTEVTSMQKVKVRLDLDWIFITTTHVIQDILAVLHE